MGCAVFLYGSKASGFSYRPLHCLQYVDEVPPLYMETALPWPVGGLHYWQMVSTPHFKGGGSCAMPPAFIWEFSVCCCRANYFTVVVFYRMAIEWQAAFLLDAKLILISLFLFSEFSRLKQTQTWPMSEVLVWSSEKTWTHSNCREINWNHAAAV